MIIGNNTYNKDHSITSLTSRIANTIWTNSDKKERNNVETHNFIILYSPLNIPLIRLIMAENQNQYHLNKHK